jgi:hypothetical protein
MERNKLHYVAVFNHLLFPVSTLCVASVPKKKTLRVAGAKGVRPQWNVVSSQPELLWLSIKRKRNISLEFFHGYFRYEI